MKRTFDDQFGEEIEAREDQVEDEGDDEDWKAPIIDGVMEHKDGRYQQALIPGHHRTIVHIDLDCFYAQVEMIRNPSLRDKPLGIQQKNIVVTTNYVAREYGVGKLSYIKDALQKCPELVLVSGEDLTHYREMSYKVTGVLQRFEPIVERLGFDENYLNVSALVEQRLGQQRSTDATITGHVYNNAKIPECSCGCHQRLAIGSQIAKEMRDTLYSELGITSCAGVAHNKLLAKLVGGHKKPNDQTLIYPEQAEELMVSLGKVRAIPGIGSSTGKRLAGMGISTIQDLQEASKTVLESEFGHQQAHRMLSLSHGIDETPVISTGAPQSISDEDSFKKCSTIQNAKERILDLLQNLLKRLKADGRIPQTIRVTVRKYSTQEWKRESRQCSVAVSIFKSLNTDENATLNKLLDICIGLFRKMVDTTKQFNLTLINICFAKMQDTTKSGSINHFFSPKPRSSEKSSADDSPVTTKYEPKPKNINHFFSPKSSKTSSNFVDTPGMMECQQKPKNIEHFVSPRSSDNSSNSWDKSPGMVKDHAKPESIKHFFSQKSSETSSNFVDKSPVTMRAQPKMDSIDHFFSPRSSESTISNNSCSKGETFIETLHDSKTLRTKLSVASPSEVLIDNKETPKTIEAFFTSPKRKRTRTSESSPRQFEANLSGYQKPKEELNRNSFFNTKSKSDISNMTHKSDKREIEDRQSDFSDSDLSRQSKLFDSGIPPNVDPDVFKQLPDDLQQELRAEYTASESSSRTHTDFQESLPQSVISDKTFPKSAKQSCTDSCSNAKSIPGNFSSSIFNVNDQLIPPNVDPGVFMDLPSDMQNELIEDWKRKMKHSDKKDLSGKGKMKHKNILQYFKK